MASIQKANAFPTKWVGDTPKYGLKVRTTFRAGLTDEECKARFRRMLRRVDEEEDERRKKAAYLASDEYARSRMTEFMHKEIASLTERIRQMHTNNSGRFAGGYTGPAIIDHKMEVDRINAFEAKAKAEIEKKYDGSAESLAIVREMIKAEEALKKIPMPTWR